VAGKSAGGFWNKLTFVARHSLLPWEKGCLGFIITALMLCLGANFWFDLLRKLISLRNAGAKPEESEAASTPKQDPPKQPAADPAQAAGAGPNATARQAPPPDPLGQLKSSMHKETGIVTIGTRWSSPGFKMTLDVHVRDAGVLTKLSEKYGAEVKVSDKETIAISYVVSQSPGNDAHLCAAPLGRKIGNKSRRNGFGTLGCYMGRAGDNKAYLLSCWHVLKDNVKWSEAPLERGVIEGDGNKTIAAITDGCLHEKIDIGMAECDFSVNDADNCGVSKGHGSINHQHRPVSPADAFNNTKVCIYGNKCGYKEASIYYDETDAPIRYPDGNTYLMKDLFSVTVIDPVNDAHHAPTAEGDSGAVVVDLSTGEPLGMIIGGNGQFSYAMKFTNAFDADAIYSDYFFLLKNEKGPK
jgi:hypothetical protein